MKFLREIFKFLSKNNYLHNKLDYSYTFFIKKSRTESSFFKKLLILVESIFLTKMTRYNKNVTTKEELIRNQFNNIKIFIDRDDYFIHSIDVHNYIETRNNIINNITMDYNIILDNSLNSLNVDNNLKKAIESVMDKTLSAINSTNLENKKKLLSYFKNMKKSSAMSFEEALQRILFYNQLLWQTKHNLNGLGRLDSILNNLYETDLRKGIISRDSAKELLKQFMKSLHKYYWFKSNTLMGDTGQIIVLGGNDKNNIYQSNDLTYLFIEALMELQLPDPKILLRVSKNMPKDLMRLSLQSISTGIGCPLLSNDDVVVEKHINFGIKKEDAYNYVVSACWEPTIIGKDFGQNNIKIINFLKPFHDMLDKEDLDCIKSTDELIEKYYEHLKKYMDSFLAELNMIKWEKDPLLSMFFKDCVSKKRDLSNGTIYNDYGCASIALGNLVNSILNIDRYVFKDKLVTLKELNEKRKNNFDDIEILNLLRDNELRYGKDNEEVINLTNIITSKLSDIISTYKNMFGGTLKFGLSSPSYISDSVNFEASFDGRKKNEPFYVHISCDKAIAYTEIVSFGARLDYSKQRFNGNVLDFIVMPSFIEKNFEKFVDFLMFSTELGFFQMQMNVVSSDILIKAKNSPNDFPNLIVRVWGFSAYFNDLPEEYKDLLIKRALESENVNGNSN